MSARELEVRRHLGGGRWETVRRSVHADGRVETAEEAEAREVEAHLGLVYHVARRMARRLPDVELGDLVSWGTIGLVAAVRAFDPSRGLALSTLAAPRIRGAILDGLRTTDHVPRSVRRKERAIGGAREVLMRELEREPTAAELAERLAVDVETLARWRTHAEGTTRLPFDAPAPARGTRREGLRLRDTLVGGDGADAERRVVRQQELQALSAALESLSTQQRRVLALYYGEELSLRQVGEVLQLSEARISQVRSKALQQLRTHPRLRALARTAA